MNIKEHLFVDWRPIASIPIFIEELSSSDWQTADASSFPKLELTGDFSDVKIEYRYVCRNDGLILFSIRTLEMDLRAATSVAYAIAYQIKKQCGHWHVFDTDHSSSAYSDLTSYPVLCEDKAFVDLSSCRKFCMNDDQLKELRAKSVRTGEISDRKALPTIKKLYSRLFDRVSKRAFFHDRNVTAFGWNSSTQKGRFMFFVINIVACFMLLGLLAADQAFHWKARKEILSGTVFLALSALALLRVRYDINAILHGKIRLHRRLTAYYSHANNLSRVLWRIYQVELNNPSNDFEPIINLTEGMIDATNRRMNNYIFYFGSVLTLLAIFVALV